ncbi:hypothetical protein EBR21_02440, partial [bacterium]|nr:hypothetical protein [bacterium]
MLQLAKKTILFLLTVFSLQKGFAQTQLEKSSSDHAQPLTSSWIVGVDADLSLGGASAGRAILRGVQIAAEEINAAGGVLGKKIRVEARDHASVVLRGIENLKELVQYENLIGVVGGMHSNVILSELKFIHEKRIPYLIPWAAANELIDNGYEPNFVFRLGARDRDVSRFLLSEALKRGNRIALLLETTVWGRSNHRAITSALAARGLKPVAIEWIDRADTDVNIQISSIQKSKPDVVILALNSPEGAMAIKTMAARSTKFEVISHWGIAQKNFFLQSAAALASTPVEFFQPFSVLQSGFKKRTELADKLMREDQLDSIAKIDSFVG